MNEAPVQTGSADAEVESKTLRKAHVFATATT
jgi:hypothetical protein